jgi:hypothetical protein
MAKAQAASGERNGMTVARSYAVVLVPSSDGGFVVTVPALPEVGTQGETVDEALEMARDAIAPDDAPVLERVQVQIEAAFERSYVRALSSVVQRVVMPNCAIRTVELPRFHCTQGP